MTENKQVTYSGTSEASSTKTSRFCRRLLNAKIGSRDLQHWDLSKKTWNSGLGLRQTTTCLKKSWLPIQVDLSEKLAIYRYLTQEIASTASTEVKKIYGRLLKPSTTLLLRSLCSKPRAPSSRSRREISLTTFWARGASCSTGGISTTWALL